MKNIINIKLLSALVIYDILFFCIIFFLTLTKILYFHFVKHFLLLSNVSQYPNLFPEQDQIRRQFVIKQRNSELTREQTLPLQLTRKQFEREQIQPQRRFVPVC